MTEQLGESFVRGIAERDAATLLALLRDDIDFKAMTPRKFWEETSPAGIVDKVILGTWFEESDRIVGIDAIEHDQVADRRRVGYRFHVTNDDGDFTVEQQAYYDVNDGRIGWMRIMCAGYQPRT